MPKFPWGDTNGPQKFIGTTSGRKFHLRPDAPQKKNAEQWMRQHLGSPESFELEPYDTHASAWQLFSELWSKTANSWGFEMLIVHMYSHSQMFFQGNWFTSSLQITTKFEFRKWKFSSRLLHWTCRHTRFPKCLKKSQYWKSKNLKNWKVRVHATGIICVYYTYV